MKNLAEQARELLLEQDQSWPLLHENRALLAGAKVRMFQFEGFEVRAQLNLGRLGFALRRPGGGECFLCDRNRPREQTLLPCGGGFNLMCNPYPILPEHFTIIHQQHQPQRILGSLEPMLELARAVAAATSQSGFMVFYNGPQCGASAPDHLHLQAGPIDSLPAIAECPRVGRVVLETDHLRILAGNRYLRRFVLIESARSEQVLEAFGRLYQAQQALQPQSLEPMMNILCSYDEGRWRVIVFPRCRHRPSAYSAPEHERLLISPGALDVGGVIVVPVAEHFQRISAQDIARVYDEITLDEASFARLVQAMQIR